MKQYRDGSYTVQLFRAQKSFLQAYSMPLFLCLSAFGIGGNMSQLEVTNLTFGYENSPDLIFEDVSFSIDTNWKLGLIGRNGKGKTTFLNLLLGKYEYRGRIRSSVAFDYFPFAITESFRDLPLSDFMTSLTDQVEEWRVMIEMAKLNLSAELLYRPFRLLSNGEQTKCLLAILFSRENLFLLIDEPTNHLDRNARDAVKEYLKAKKGFILVSHDRDLLDAVTDHVLVLNRATIQVQNGNFSTWWENKERADAFNRSENEKHLKEISSLKKASQRIDSWADQNESRKIGFNPIKEHDRFMDTRAYIGAKTKKAQARVKALEKRIDREIEEKEGLLKDIEKETPLELRPMQYFHERLIFARDYFLKYKGSSRPVINDLYFELTNGERVALSGANGSGKSSLIKAILNRVRNFRTRYTEQLDSFLANAEESGILDVGSGLIVSYISQDTSFLRGPMDAFIRKEGLDEVIFKAVLRKLDFERGQFEKNMEDYSEGQKKKVLIAASLVTPAHLYIWDEPLNYIDVFSRMQIEELILKFKPTLLFVEHDVRFTERIATKEIRLG